MKILVTGSSGTIGTRLCERLIADGHSVQGIDVKKNKWKDSIPTAIIDLRKAEQLEGLGGFDLIVHLAANARVYNLVVDPNKALDNIVTTFNILEFARRKKIPKIMFASSREVYGNIGEETITEDAFDIKNAESAYSASKISGEALIRAYQNCYDIDFIIFRLSNVYGMYDDTDRVVPLYIEKTRKNEDLVVFGSDKVLDFTYIDDCVDGFLLGIKKFEGMKNDTYNLAYGDGISIIELAKLICKILGSKSNVSIDDNRTGEVVRYISDISKISGFGFSPKVDINTGIKMAIDWYKKFVP